MLLASWRQPHLLHVSAVDRRQTSSVDKSWRCVTLSGPLHNHIVRCRWNPISCGTHYSALFSLMCKAVRMSTFCKVVRHHIWQEVVHIVLIPRSSTGPSCNSTVTSYENWATFTEVMKIKVSTFLKHMISTRFFFFSKCTFEIDDILLI